MQYIVISKITVRGLEKEVNRYLKKEWKLQGGVSHGGEDGNSYQAMIKED